jgi:hypothetical protein
MRTTFPLMIAVALTAATPAIAQGTDNVANANTTATAAANDTGATDSMTVTTDPAMAGNDANAMDAAPVAMDVPADAPAPAEKKSFPWGVIGILGLIGVLGRKRG